MRYWLPISYSVIEFIESEYRVTEPEEGNFGTSLSDNTVHDYSNNHDHFEVPCRRRVSTNVGTGSRRLFPPGRAARNGVRDSFGSLQRGSRRRPGQCS